jgi:mannose/cellobiose epimerase-like protein (N-acyl-D-glucosamine 2-epimerase family)
MMYATNLHRIDTDLGFEPRSWLGLFDYDRLLHPVARSTNLPVVERFDWAGRPVDPGFRRIRVMARQTYVLSHAGIGGISAAAAAAPRAARALMERGVDNGQFQCRLAPNGAVLDPTADLYDIAFGLFAMAWWYRFSGDEEALILAEQSVENVRAELASPSGRGFVARAGDAGPHQQNPHMHLFEAAIFLAAFSGRPVFRTLADELFVLAEEAMVDFATGTLAELFDDNWRPVAHRGPVRIEPGHHYEWVWLLHRYGALADQPRAYAIADRLFEFALLHGHDPRTGLVLAAVSPRGDSIATDLRAWPNTEFLKAQIAMRERHGSGPGFNNAAVEANLDRICSHFLKARATGPAAGLGDGLWIDCLEGGTLRPKSDHVPASTLYHLFFGFSELLRHRRGHAHFSGLPW